MKLADHGGKSPYDALLFMVMLVTMLYIGQKMRPVTKVIYPADTFDVCVQNDGRRTENYCLITSQNQRFKNYSADFDLSRVLQTIKLDPNMMSISENVVRYNYLPAYKNPCWRDSGSTLRCLPYVYTLGTAKAGTTMLYKFVTSHQHVAPPNRKEVNFWNSHAKEKDIFQYTDSFTNATLGIAHNTQNGASHKITLEGTPSYFYHHGSSLIYNGTHDEGPLYTLAHTLYAVNPRTKLIVLLRNPTDRLFSSYHQRTKRKKAFSPTRVHQIVEANIQRFQRCLDTHSLRSCAFNKQLRAEMASTNVELVSSLYYPFASEWLRVFPRDQVLILASESFYSAPWDTLDRVFAFLGLDSPDSQSRAAMEGALKYRYQKFLTNHTAAYRSSLLPATRKLLDNFYQPYNKMLADLLGDQSFLFERSSDDNIPDYDVMSNHS